jgi:hypothetical protein
MIINSALRMRCVAALERYVRGIGYGLEGKPCHVFPRAYVVARPAVACLVVATPPCDSEDQVGKYNNSAQTYHGNVFDPALQVGDWCTTGYLSLTRNGVWCCGVHVAIPAVP